MKLRRPHQVVAASCLGIGIYVADQRPFCLTVHTIEGKRWHWMGSILPGSYGAKEEGSTSGEARRKDRVSENCEVYSVFTGELWKWILGILGKF
jgi:hypothetical protein